MEHEEIAVKSNLNFKTKILKLLIPFLAGGILVFTLLLVYYLYVLAPNWILKKEEAVQIKQEVIDNFSCDRTEPLYENVDSSDNCPIILYENESTKEFYSLRVDNEDWIPISSNRVGVRFEYPVKSNSQILYSFYEWPKREFDPSGKVFSWTIKDLEDEFGTVNMAWGASADLKIGRMSVDVYKWTEQDGKYFIHAGIDTTYEVEKKLVRDTSFGTQALLFETPCYYFCDHDTPPPSETNLIINLPFENRKDIESIIFYIPDSMTNDDIERLIESVELLN